MPIENECQTTTNEMYPELEVTVAAFSGGPIGPGDRYDTFNKTLIMATWYSKSCKYVTRFWENDPNCTSVKTELTPTVDSYTTIPPVRTLSITIVQPYNLVSRLHSPF